MSGEGQTHRLLLVLRLHSSRLRRGSASLTLFLLLATGFAPVRAESPRGTSPVARLEFLAQAIEALYGEIQGEYPVPFTGVPSRAAPVVGLALALDALHGWERSTAWDAPVTRGQALHVLFRLAQFTPAGITSRRSFRDVAAGKTALVERAESWNLLTPLTPGYFGWNRTLTIAEFERMLGALPEHLALPLTPPPAGTLPAGVRAPDPARSRRGVLRPAKDTGKSLKDRGITVEFSIDPGGGRNIQGKELPRSDLLSAIWGLIQSRYLHLDKVEGQEVAYRLAEEMLRSLGDPYTTFFRPSSAKSFQEQLQGKLSGIGAQVETHPQGGVLVVSPLTGSPALKAGIRPGDRITHVNGESILELNLQDAVAKIRGPVGSTVKLTISREGGTLTFDVVRAEISIPEIEVSMHDGVAVVRLYQFGERTIRELGTLLKEVLAQEPAGMVLDLRNNPGGLLDGAISVLSHFFPQGTTAAQIKTRGGSRAEVTRGLQVVPSDLPLAVLVNAGSASASEIVAGALQDLSRATVIGAKTFGKGTVQEVTQFETGESAKITTGEWFTPFGRSLEKTGIIPDVAMEESDARDEVLLRGIAIVKAKARTR